MEIVVDNARTHSAKSHSISDFSKGIGTKCPIDKIEYNDSKGKPAVLHCFFQSGPHKGKSKGLIELAKELEIKLPPKIKLDELRELLSDHPAFKTVRNYFINELQRDSRSSLYRSPA